MSARRIARELAVITLPQLPKDTDKLSKQDLNLLVAKSVSLLADHAKQCLADADALLEKASSELTNIEVEHPDNKNAIEELNPVPVTTDVLKNQIDLVERALRLTAEALDIPEISLLAGGKDVAVKCPKCHHTSQAHLPGPEDSKVLEHMTRLVDAFLQNKEQIDKIVQQVKSKWRLERMITIDRDIIRLACAEAFYVSDVPVNVTISEAVELAHRFADQKAAKFINGVLGDLAEAAQHFRRTGELLDLSALDANANENKAKIKQP